MKHLTIVLVLVGLYSTKLFVGAVREERLPEQLEQVTGRVHEARKILDEAERVLEKEGGHYEHEKPGFLERVKESLPERVKEVLHVKPEREKEYYSRDYEHEYPTDTVRRKAEEYVKEGKEYVKRQVEPEQHTMMDSFKEALHLKSKPEPSPTEYIKEKGHEWFGLPSAKEETYLGIPHSVWNRVPRKVNEAKDEYIERVKNYFTWLNRKAGETEQEYSDRIKQGYESVKQRAADTLEQTKYKAQEAGETVKSKVAETGEAIKGRMAETGEAIKGRVAETGEAIKSKIGGAYEGMKHGAEQLKHKTEEAVHTIEHKAEDVGHDIKSKFQDLGENIKEKVYSAKEQVPSSFREAGPSYREKEREHERIIKEYIPMQPETHWYTPFMDMIKAGFVLIPASLAALVSVFGLWELWEKGKQYRTLYPVGLHSTFATWERSGPLPSGKAEKVAEPSKPVPHPRIARAAFILAHADDETMFFAPTITDIKKMGHEVFLQVITSGTLKNDPRSQIRKQELLKAAHVFGVHTENIEVLDDPRLVERANWLDYRTELNTHVANFISRNGITHVYTFDRYGVTGYLNHSSVHMAVRDYVNAHPDVRAFELQTVWKLRQWAGFLDLLWTVCNTVKSRLSHQPADFLYLHMNFMPIEMYSAVDKAHWTRLVPFRLMRILFNRYAFINSWRPIHPSTTATVHTGTPLKT
jgi:N-acetylglucosaminylphosphatidylinositol deacetylase